MIVCTNKALLIVPFSMCCIPITNKEIQANNKKNNLCPGGTPLKVFKRLLFISLDQSLFWNNFCY